MTFSNSNCIDTQKRLNFRKGLSAIASRRTGLVLAKASASLEKVQNTAVPKEISAAKCHSISFMAL